MRIMHRYQIRRSQADQLVVSLNRGEREGNLIWEHCFKQGASRSEMDQFLAKKLEVFWFI
jgi:hypothetical protein